MDANDNRPLVGTEIYNVTTNQLIKANPNGFYTFKNLTKGRYELTIFSFDYSTSTVEIDVDENVVFDFFLIPLSTRLTEVEIRARKIELFGLRRLQPVEGTAIYSGKKTEVVLLDQSIAALASNTARQIYAQIVGLNIYESGDAGLQLSIGGRGLDPNRTANFNTRQNNYDISPDVLGYPESYYTPPAEALSEIQVVRGAASLQYGTQFGGLINFKVRKPNPEKTFSINSRQTIGSFGLRTSFNSISGTKGKFGYYGYFNYKQGDGYRQNSEFKSSNAYAYLRYNFNDRTKLSLESTYMNYLAQQAGGLTDRQFREDPIQSNRERNWFEVDWKLYNAKLNHKFSNKTEFNLSIFALDAERNTVGFRGNPIELNVNPITALDEQDLQGDFVNPRDIIIGNFNNYGAEFRLLSEYLLAGNKSIFLIGGKYYNAKNRSLQGPGSTGTDADFELRTNEFEDYANQSNFEFPNRNFSLFGEHIFYITKNFSVTPGLRFENIKTESIGVYQNVVFDNAGNPINNATLRDDRTLDRSFVLAGIGLSRKWENNTELYANISQNYRSVTFSDIRVVSPTFIIDADITDEKGYTADLGWRGRVKKALSYDVGTFLLRYDNRIGIVLDDRANRVRKNIGTALIYGFESFLDWNILESLNLDYPKSKLNLFLNTAITSSEYISSEANNIEGKRVEFIPNFNFKSGIKIGHKNTFVSLQYSFLSEQYTDAENSSIPQDGDLRSGVIGEIPSYGIADFSMSTSYKFLTLESGILNIFDKNYFTRRATGYPGPGIIPSDGRSFYLTLGFKL